MKVSRLLKPVSKVDLRDCIFEDCHFWKAKLLSAYKKFSRVKTLFVMNPRNKPEVKDSKYPPQLKNLIYQLNCDYFALLNNNLSNPRPDLAHNYLKYLKYSPRMNSFILADYSSWHFPKVGSKGRNYLRSLEALKTCKLISFSLKTPIEEGHFTSLAKFVESMEHLEYFELHIPDLDFLFNEDSLIIEMCKQINKHQKLRNLNLDFQNFNGIKSTKITNFIPYLCDLFTKPIKMETLSIACYQLDPSQGLGSLMPLLETSAATLTRLRIDSRALTGDKKMHKSIMKFLRKLSNIQVLEIPCLGINVSTIQFLDDIAEVVHELKYLRVLELGKIKGIVLLSAFYQKVEAIVSERGLRKFQCSLSKGLQNKLARERNVMVPNTKRIVEKNPYLETIDISNDFHHFYGIEAWTETQDPI